MKIPRLGEIELARNAPLALEQQRGNLLQIMDGNARMWYAPVRKMYQDIFNVGSSLFGPGASTSWSVIARELRKKCKSELIWKHNLAVADELHKYCVREKISGHAHDFGPMPMGSAAGNVFYWLPMVLFIRGASYRGVYRSAPSRVATVFGWTAVRTFNDARAYPEAKPRLRPGPALP